MACGLVLAAALGVPAAAQAAVTRPGPADTGTTAAAPAISYPCAPLDSLGSHIPGASGQYAGFDSSGYIYFGADLAHAIYFCNVNQGNGQFWIMDQATGNCLTFYFVPEFGREVLTELSCAPNFAIYWEGINEGAYHSQPVWEFKAFAGPPASCLYDYVQDPATYGNCVDTNIYEHFVWDALWPR
jgi:hypothetical protein